MTTTESTFEGGKKSARPTERLLQSSWGIGWAGQDLNCAKKLPRGQKKLASISHFQDYQIIARTFI